jgi:hypothetical protein
MTVLFTCPCGQRWTSAEGRAAQPQTCPVCGRRLTPLTPGGWRSLAPRLALAATATTLAVILAGVLLAQLLPRRSTPQPVAAEQTTPSAEAAPSRSDSVLTREVTPPPSSPVAPEKTTAVPVLPLLDNPPPLEKPTAPPSSAPPLDKPKERPAATIPELPADKDFFQHLVISRVSRYRIAELDLGQNVQYVLVSRFHVKKKNDDGSLLVEQKVESVRLSNADPALQARLNELLQKTKGAAFTLRLNARREVTKFEGGPQKLAVLAGDNPLGGPSFLLWSFLDRDGWKELAQLSYFQPPAGVRRGERWTRPMTHSWGPLGNWDGKIHYQAGGKQAGHQRYDYQLELAYKPPPSTAGLPFEIGKSQFQIQTARGVLAYDPERGRVAAAEERFHVRGLLTVSLLGVESLVQMDEMQLFQLRIVDKNPLQP